METFADQSPIDQCRVEPYPAASGSYGDRRCSSVERWRRELYGEVHLKIEDLRISTTMFKQ